MGLENQVNLPLLMAGAAMLGAEGDAGDAISAAIQAYTNTELGMREREQKSLDKELERGFKERQLEIQEMQNELRLREMLKPDKSNIMKPGDVAKIRQEAWQNAVEQAGLMVSSGRISGEEYDSTVKRLFGQGVSAALGKGVPSASTTRSDILENNPMIDQIRAAVKP